MHTQTKTKQSKEKESTRKPIRQVKETKSVIDHIKTKLTKKTNHEKTKAEANWGIK